MIRFLLAVALWSGIGGAHATEPEPLNPLQGLDKDALTGFRERPLFAPSRRPALVPPPEAVAASPVQAAPRSPPPALRLVGVMRAGALEAALIRQGDSPRTTVLRSGERLGEWTATVVSGQILRLSRGEETVEFRLFAQKTGPVAMEPASKGLFTVPVPRPSPDMMARDNRLRSRSY